VTDATGKYFGLVIAYVLPGFAALWSLQESSPTIRSWLQTSASLPAGLEAIFFVSLASIASGMTISTVRWAVVDTLLQMTGLHRPAWDDAKLQANVQAWELIVEAHYRFYQFYGHMAVVLPLFIASQSYGRTWGGILLGLLFECLFIAAAHDALSRYYARTSLLLGTISHEVKLFHDQRQPQTSSRERNH